MAWTSGKAAADLGSLLALVTGERGAPRRGCWPGKDEAKDLRRCWPDPSDLPAGDIRPEDAMRKIMRGRSR